MTHVTYRPTAKNSDQPWNPTLGNRVWATLTFLLGPTCLYSSFRIVIIRYSMLAVGPLWRPVRCWLPKRQPSNGRKSRPTFRPPVSARVSRRYCREVRLWGVHHYYAAPVTCRSFVVQVSFGDSSLSERLVADLDRPVDAWIPCRCHDPLHWPHRWNMVRSSQLRIDILHVPNFRANVDMPYTRWPEICGWEGNRRSIARFFNLGDASSIQRS